MKQIKTLVFLQLKDKLDVSWMYSSKSRIHTVILSLVKFAIITAAFTILFNISKQMGLFYYDDMPQIMTVVLSVVLFLSLISCTFGLMKALYFAEDNKVLITMPVSGNKIFISKILVFYFYEIKKSFGLLIPILLACAISMSNMHWTSFLWMLIPVWLIISLPVLLGALLSIPLLYITRFVNKHYYVKVILFIIAIVAFISGAVFLINLIPENIDLINQWKQIRAAVVNFLNGFERNAYLIKQIVLTLIGEKNYRQIYAVNGWTILKLVSIIAINIGLFIATYYASRPLFFNMMSKSFEFSKNEGSEAKNVKHGHLVTFNIKEFKINLRSLEISVNYLAVYVVVPLLIFLINKIFNAMDLKESGELMTYSFNILLITLPLLSSNSLIATLYSKEGRAGYIKKTKPIKPIIPLVAKLGFNLLFSLPSIIVSVIIFGFFSKIGSINTIIIVFAILLLHYGHIFSCATLDIMNPQNEAYATSGDGFNNVNENKATIAAFIISILYALFSYKLFSESSLYTNGVGQACFKLLFISISLCAYFVISFVLKVKAFYNEK